MWRLVLAVGPRGKPSEARTVEEGGGTTAPWPLPRPSVGRAGTTASSGGREAALGRQVRQSTAIAVVSAE